jgi:predicted Zn-dependent peptidase
MYYEVNCNDNNSEKVLKLIFDKFSNLKITDKEVLNNIKESLKMNYNDSLEYSEFVNTCIGKSAFDGNFDSIANYNSILEKITLDDVNDYIKNYINISKAAVTAVHPETTEENILNNYKEAKSITFKSKSRKPINTDKVSTAELDNNYKIAFSESKNNNTPFTLTLKYDVPQNVNPAAFLVLSQILSMGTMDMPEKEFKRALEKENISVVASASKDVLVLAGYSSADNFEKTTNKALELLNSPRITESEVKKAIEHIKDVYSRYDKSSRDLYEEYESKNNPHYESVDEILSGLDYVTTGEVQSLYNYIINNSKGIVTVNIPESANDMKSRAY